MVVEVMGRHTGWIAVMSGIAGGADVILIPEQPITVEDACAELVEAPREWQGLLHRRRERGLRAHVRVGRAAARRRRGAEHAISSATSCSAASATRSPARSSAHRIRDAGHGSRPRPARRHPDARDRVLATRFGLKAADLVHERRFGRMAALQGDAIGDVSLEEATAEIKTVPAHWYEVARALLRLTGCGASQSNGRCGSRKAEAGARKAGGRTHYPRLGADHGILRHGRASRAGCRIPPDTSEAVSLRS